MECYDVIVLGAGPAGCASAIHCAQQGLKVAIIERHANVRDRPGETLHPGIEPLLRQLGVADHIMEAEFIRPTGTWVAWQHTRQFVPFGADASGPWRGFQLPRRALDSLLLETASDLGVDVRRPCYARRVILHDRRVTGIHTDQHSLYCDHLIDASGAHAWLTRQLNLTVHTLSAPLTVFYGYLHTDEHCGGPTEGIFADNSGWYWVADLGQGRYAWTRLYFVHPKDKTSIVPLPLKRFEHLGRVRGADVTWRICEPLAGAGYFIAGDAAATLDPGSSHGVLKALMSGIMAAHGVVQGRASPIIQTAVSQQYRQWVQDGFHHDVKMMREFYRAHPFPPPWL